MHLAVAAERVNSTGSTQGQEDESLATGAPNDNEDIAVIGQDCKGMSQGKRAGGGVLAKARCGVFELLSPGSRKVVPERVCNACGAGIRRIQKTDLGHCRLKGAIVQLLHAWSAAEISSRG